MSRSTREYLLHIQAECEFLILESASVDVIEFHKDPLRQRAFIRSIEIIGEATKMIPDEITGTHPEIQWKQLARMRDKLIHQYFGVDLEIVWNLTVEIIPELQKAIQIMLVEISAQ
jgi:uncharacterized protein with HEPN domain